jgi:hypothetical protein
MSKRHLEIQRERSITVRKTRASHTRFSVPGCSANEFQAAAGFGRIVLSRPKRSWRSVRPVDHWEREPHEATLRMGSLSKGRRDETENTKKGRARAHSSGPAQRLQETLDNASCDQRRMVHTMAIQQSWKDEPDDLDSPDTSGSVDWTHFISFLRHR